MHKETGEVLGEHKGFWFYTIGQRKGLGLSGGPWFVIEKDARENVIYLARGYDPAEVYRSDIELANFNWINRPEDFDSGEHNIQFKIRHTPELTDGRVKIDGERMIIHSAEPVHGVAAGQFGVIYKEDECLGGGVIINT